MKLFRKFVASIFIFSFLVLLFGLYSPTVTYADPNVAYNGTVSKVDTDGTLTIDVEVAQTGTSQTTTQTYTVKPTSGTFKVGDNVEFTVIGGNPVASSVQLGWSNTANAGGGSQQQTTSNASYSNPGITFYLFPDLTCSADSALTCWMKQVFEFSQTAILLLATAVIVFAGIIYMTSAGNPKQIELAKRLILGALSGVAVIILGKFFLVSVVGVPTAWL
jgi:hypothetical protein